jgi:hypothetical protein
MKQPSISSSPQWNRTRISSSLGIEYPIIQGPLGGLSTQRLTATVSNFGGLGSFGADGLSPSAIKDVITEIRALTPRPFAINLWVSIEDKGAGTSGSEAFARSLATLAGHIQALGGTLPAYKPYVPIKFEDQVRVLLDAKVPVFSFIYGIPPKEILDECRAQGILTIGAATTPDEAIVLEQAGVDVIAASGFEAGGHRGSFLLPSEESLTGRSRWYLKSQTPFHSPWLPPEASPMLAESSQLLLWEPRAYKSARLFWLVKNPVRACITAMRSSAAKQSKPLLRVDSRGDSPVESKTGFLMNSITRGSRSFHTRFNAHSSGTFRYRLRRQGEPIFSLYGPDKAPTCRGVQMRMGYWTRL